MRVQFIFHDHLIRRRNGICHTSILCRVPDSPLHKAICAGLSVGALGFLDSRPEHWRIANAISTVSKLL